MIKVLYAIFMRTLAKYWEERECPTWLLIIVTYSAWMILTYHYESIPLWISILTGSILVCLHGSLQHEAIHNHPTKIDWLNTTLVSFPLGIWMPYLLYKKFHLNHHETPKLSHPGLDTESFYVSQSTWNNIGPLAQSILWINQTILGRLIIGPPLFIITSIFTELKKVSSLSHERLTIYLNYVIFFIPTYYWIAIYCNINFLDYFLFIALPGHSLTMLRSYFEHKPGKNNSLSTAIIEGCPITRLVYLNNNYHLIHHLQQNLPWFKIKAEFEQNKEHYLNVNQHYYFKHHYELMIRYLFQPKDSPIHPHYKHS